MAYEEIIDPAPLPYRERFSRDEYEKIKLGLEPADMDDKWAVHFDHPYLRLHRSWTGQGVFRVELKEDPEGVAAAEAVCASAVLADSNPEYQSEILAFLIGNLLLGKALPFPNPEGIAPEHPGLYQHAVAGTGFPETSRRRPWWKFWK